MILRLGLLISIVDVLLTSAANFPGKSCSVRDRKDTGICVRSDRVNNDCLGAKVLIEKSRDCALSDEWCCFGSPDSRNPRAVASEADRLRASEDRATNDTVDSSPCGHGRNGRRFGVEMGFRQFARIFQGTPTVEGDFCWVVAIFSKGNAALNEPTSFRCAGTIVNSTHIITAGHCVDNFLTQPSQIFIQTGLSNAEPAVADGILNACSQRFQVTDIILPGRYDPIALTEDHALLRISGVIRADECACRVCMPDRGPVPELSGVATCWVAGFGATREGGTGSLQLTKAPIQFIRRDRCQVLLGGMLTAGAGRLPLTDSSFCAGDAQLGGLCNHDGGAPLTCLIGGRHTLVGVGSWSVDCSKYPSVFSSLAACADFLQDSNAPCDPARAQLKGAIVLTDLQLNGGPTCGITGNQEIDPFKLANQNAAVQAFNAAQIKRSVQGIIAAMTSKVRPTGSITMMPEDLALSLEQRDGDVEEKKAPINGSEEVLANNDKMSKPPFAAATIVGGVSAPANEICWQVLVSTGCGGTIISDQFILTAAHCVTVRGTTIPRNPLGVKVITGATSSPVIFPLQECQQIKKVRRIIVHENYFLGNETDQYVAFDIALLELDSPIDFSQPCVCRICLQNAEPVPGEICTASGFGCQLPTAPGSACTDRNARILMRLNLTMPGDDVCSLFFTNFPSHSITCSASNKGHAPCFGDSGGPVVCYNSEQSTYYQAGVTSFAVFPDGVGQCGMGKVNLQYYTKVNAFIGWIRDSVPDVMVAEPGSFNFHASFNIDLGKGVSSMVTGNQLLPVMG